MTAATLTLTDFLLARIAEDESEAREAEQGGFGQWETYATGAWVTGVRRAVDGVIICQARSRPGGSNALIARHDPARVLAECEAKRRIIARESYDRPRLGAPPYNGLLTRDDGEPGRHPDLIAYIAEHGELVTDTPTFRALALPYANHPDYRHEWRP